MVTTLTSQKSTKKGAILRVYGNGDARVKDVYEYLKTLEEAYNSIYIFEQILEEAKKLQEFYQEKESILPLRNLLPLDLWQLDTENRRNFIPQSDSLKLVGVEIHSPGFWDFLAKLNPLEVIRVYLNDRHERQKDNDYRNEEEKVSLQLENENKKLEIMQKKINILKEVGGTEEDLALIRMNLVCKPLKQLNRFQDDRIIMRADLVD